MATDKPSTDGFLAVIEAKIAALKALADTYRTALSLGALGKPGDVDFSKSVNVVWVRAVSTPFELPQGALLGKSLPAAIKLYLSAVKKSRRIETSPRP